MANAPAPVTAQPASPFAAFWSAFSQNRGAVGGLIILLTIIVLAIFAEWIAPYSAIEQFRGMTKLPPAWAEGGDARFVLGTDALGRDMLSRLIYGARISLFIGLSVMSVSVVIGITLGLVAAFMGGVIDSVLMRIMDLIMSIPSLVLAILVVSILGPSLTNTIVAVSVVYLPNYVRLVRGSALAEFGKDYIIAAKVAGVGPIRLMFVTVLPNCLAPLIVQAALGVSNAILEAALKIALQNAAAQEKSGFALLAAAIVSNISYAETRSWTALPKNFQAARVETPKDGVLRIRTATGRDLGIVNVPKDVSSIVYIKMLRAQSLPSVQVLKF